MALRDLSNFQGIEKADYKPRQVTRSEFRTDVLERLEALENAVFGGLQGITFKSTNLGASFFKPTLFSAVENIDLNAGNFSATFNTPTVTTPGVSDVYTDLYKDLY